MQSSSVQITGVGLVSPLGTSADETWNAIVAGKCGIRPLTAIESPLPAGKDGGQAVELPADFSPELPREARYLRFAIVQAMRDAGVLETLPCEPARACYMLGTTLHGMRAGGRFLRTGNFDELRTFLAGDTLRLATEGLNVRGGAATTCSACSSSLGSIALGVTLLQSGAADLVIAGGYDAISEYVYAGFNALRLVSDPPLRPFTRGRVGMKLAESYAIVVLERAEDAVRRGRAPVVTIAGWGESADAHHLTQPHPQGAGATRAMRDALDRAAITPGDIGLVAAHATGTPDNDASEFAALSTLLGDRLSEVPVVAFKSHLGHTLGGAGAAELILSAMAIRDQTVPACANVTPDTIEYPGLRVTHARAERASISHTLNTSLGFGGANTSVVLSAPTPGQRPGSDRQKHKAVITGVGVLLPGIVGNDALKSHFVSASKPAWQRPLGIADADFQHLLNARRIRRMSPYVKLTLAAVALACTDAKLADYADTAAILGTMHGSAGFSVEYYGQIVREGMGAANPLLFAEGVPNAAAAQLSLMLGLTGACQTIIGTRTAGLDALRLAAVRIEHGDWQRAIVSAGEEADPIVADAYRHCGLHARDVTTAANESENGFVQSPGAIAFVVESVDAARARGATVYCVIDATRTASSIGDAIIPADHVIGSACATGIDRAERLALRKAGHAASPANVYDVCGELFSATPLAAIAVELLTGSHRQFAALCTDFSGIATSVRVNRGER